MTLTAGKLCAVTACVIFVLAAFGIAPGGVAMLPLGLAFLAAAHFVD